MHCRVSAGDRQAGMRLSVLRKWGVTETTRTFSQERLSTCERWMPGIPMTGQSGRAVPEPVGQVAARLLPSAVCDFVSARRVVRQWPVLVGETAASGKTSLEETGSNGVRLGLFRVTPSTCAAGLQRQPGLALPVVGGIGDGVNAGQPAAVAGAGRPD